MESDRQIGRVTVLAGERGGRYPHGNSLLVAGSEETALIDPSLSLIARAARGERLRVDRVLHSHCHEDHLAGDHLFPDAPIHAPEADVQGARSLDGMMAIYGFSPAVDATFREVLVETFHYRARPEALAFADGATFELGGARIRAIHAPGHTRGHTLFHVEPDDVLYLGDIDLTRFGPYYGDAWSNLEDFERTLSRVRELDARFYATFHQTGVLTGRAAFLEQLDRFTAVIAAREARLLAYLGEPRTLADIVSHRFVYRPTDVVAFADDVELRSMSQHLTRLVTRGRVCEVEPGRFRTDS
jgi:glyoxylase-like metal-dependent hydrolase (beta-lactamase superfamily II)